MRKRRAVTIGLIGSYCHDLILNPDGSEHRTLGGGAAYAAAVLEALSAPYEVVAKAGPDFLYAADVFRQPRIVTDARTTVFVDDYREGERRGRVEAVCAPILPGDVGGPFELAIACGIAGEVLLETLVRLREVSEVVVADAQSLLRVVEPSGEVALRAPPRGTFRSLDWLKASRIEASALDLPAVLREVSRGLLVTDGPRGLVVLTREGETHVPAAPAVERDPTGAGDCFLAGFCFALSTGRDALTAARFGAFCGARAVEEPGVPRFSRTALLAALPQ